MKINKLFVAAIAATTLLASCSKENTGTNDQTGEKATLSIGISAPESRAVGTVPTDVVGNFTAFVVDGDNTIKSKFSSTSAALTGANGIIVSTQAKKVYVIANAGDLSSTLTSEAAIVDYIADLNGTGSQNAATNRWATGEVALTSSDFVQSGNDFVAAKTVTIKFIAARITVKIENGMTGYDASATDGSLVLESVAILNARGESKLFGATSLIPATYTTGKKFYTGIDNPTTPSTPFYYFPASADYTVATTLLSNDITAGDFASTYYYYVFENDAETAAEFPTIVVITGQYDGKTVYFPVHLAPYEQWAAGSDLSPEFIKRGNSYDINIKLTGDPTITGGGSYPGDTGGTEDPTTPVITAKVEVTVTLTPWVAVTLNKEF